MRCYAPLAGERGEHCYACAIFLNAHPEAAGVRSYDTGQPLGSGHVNVLSKAEADDAKGAMERLFDALIAPPERSQTYFDDYRPGDRVQQEGMGFGTVIGEHSLMADGFEVEWDKGSRSYVSARWLSFAPHVPKFRSAEEADAWLERQEAHEGAMEFRAAAVAMPGTVVGELTFADGTTMPVRVKNVEVKDGATTVEFDTLPMKNGDSLRFVQHIVIE